MSERSLYNNELPAEVRNGRETREVIGRAALKLFAEQGIKETTIRDIATAARVAEGTMYRHYASKEDLAWRLFVHYYTTLGRELKAVQAEHEATRAKLEAMIRYFCEAYERDADMFTYLFLARHRHMQNLTPRMPNPYLVFRRVIRDGMRRGEVPPQDPDVVASMVMGIILQVIDSQILGGRIKQPVSTHTDTIVRACIHVLYA